MTTSTNDSLASIAKHVWEKCPDCRPPQVTTITLGHSEVFQVSWGCIDRGHAAPWRAARTREIPAIELLIIGACVKHLNCIDRYTSEILGAIRSHIERGEATAILLACEALAEKENPNG